MKKQLLLLTVLSVLSFKCLSQPYSGTIFVDSDIITSSDSSALAEVNFTGQGFKTIFDRRVNNWITVNAFLFEVVWNDGLTTEAVVNPEFQTVQLAQTEAEKYGWKIGQLPHCLRTDVEEIWINKGVQPFGGGNHSILIHTGQSIQYENSGILEETLVHEASHTSLDAMHAASAGWIQAQNLDGGFISDYAEEFPDREDIAESFLMWLAVRYRSDRISAQDSSIITGAIPSRLVYFDEIVCDLFPFHIENSTPSTESDKAENDIVVYPNPNTDFIQIKHNSERIFRAVIYDSLGTVVFEKDLGANQKIDLSELPNGTYFLVLHNDNKQFWKRIIKI
ncbi:MAG: T9SS type A sorting domain-containing protein [Bacteroidetes bacterium]|nr:MAG: T9SS type A sorting domain-containing protein [Bacteroidota bacterium]